MNVPHPDNEMDRLEVLRQYNILDTPAEAVFDDLTRLASYICDTPIALVSLIDAQRQWVKSKIGVDFEEAPRDGSFCAYTITKPEGMIVPNVAKDQRFAENSLVVDEPHVRFYAGTPLLTAEGYALGTLCVMDTQPRELDSRQVEALQILGQQVASQLELRRNTELLTSVIAERGEVEEALRQSAQENSLLAAAVNSATVGITIADPRLPGLPFIFVNPAFTKNSGYSAEEVVGRSHQFLYGHEIDHEAEAAIGQALANKQSATVITWNHRKDGTRYLIELTISPVLDEAGELVSVVAFQSDVTEREAAQAERERLLAEVEATYRQYLRQEWEQFLQERPGGTLRVELGDLITPKPNNSKLVTRPLKNGPTPLHDEDTLVEAKEAEPLEPANLAAPIKLRGEVIGTIKLEYDSLERNWTTGEAALVETVSEQLAQTVENLRLFGNTRQRAAREHLTRQIADKMRTAPDIDTIIETGLSELAKALGVSRTYVKLEPQPEQDKS